MNRIDQLFQTHKDHVLSIYFCAGTPTLEGTAEVIRTLDRKGVQMIEIGIPFSDPMADGPVIHHFTHINRSFFREYFFFDYLIELLLLVWLETCNPFLMFLRLNQFSK